MTSRKEAEWAKKQPRTTARLRSQTEGSPEAASTENQPETMTENPHQSQSVQTSRAKKSSREAEGLESAKEKSQGKIVRQGTSNEGNLAEIGENFEDATMAMVNQQSGGDRASDDANSSVLSGEIQSRSAREGSGRDNETRRRSELNSSERVVARFKEAAEAVDQKSRYRVSPEARVNKQSFERVGYQNRNGQQSGSGEYPYSGADPRAFMNSNHTGYSQQVSNQFNQQYGYPAQWNNTGMYYSGHQPTVIARRDQYGQIYHLDAVQPRYNRSDNPVFVQELDEYRVITPIISWLNSI